MTVEAASIVRAWYGDSRNEWDGKGKNVTSKVKQLIKQGQEVKPDIELFGDPAPQRCKVLLIERKDWVKEKFHFDKKPLAITFEDNTFPVVVASVAKNGHGFAQGIEEGMVLVEVNGEDVSSLSYKDSLQKIQLAMENLSTDESFCRVTWRT